jgi:hypothetical protein
MQIESIIAELLLRNNCVVIPKFGGFIASQKAATIDFSKGIVLPPQKAILFNKQLINNDGLLCMTFAQANKLNYELALEALDEKVSIWNAELAEGKRVSIENVGFLFLDNEKNICFEQDRFFNLLMDSFGMGQVSFQAEKTIITREISVIEPVAQREIEQTEKAIEIESPIIELFPNLIKTSPKKEKVTQEKDKKVRVDSKVSTKQILKYVAAAACILPIAFYSVWIPMKTDVLESGIISVGDFNPFHKIEKGSYLKDKFKTQFTVIPETKDFDQEIKSLQQDVLTYSMEIDEEVFFVKLKDGNPVSNEIIEDKPTLVKSEIKVIEKTEKTILPSKKGSIQVIVGSFSNQNNANDLIQKLQSSGFSASSSELENGLIRVSAGSTNSSSEANQLVKELEKIQISAWVLK